MTGTLERRFDRLIDYVNLMQAGAFTGLIQRGSSEVARIKNPLWQGKSVAYCQFSELDSAVASADFVITHAGIGSIMMSARHNKPMIVVPRMQTLNEHFDDHQLQISNYIRHCQGVYIVTSATEFSSALQSVRSVKSLTASLIGGEPLKDYVKGLHDALQA